MNYIITVVPFIRQEFDAHDTSSMTETLQSFTDALESARALYQRAQTMEASNLNEAIDLFDETASIIADLPDEDSHELLLDCLHAQGTAWDQLSNYPSALKFYIREKELSLAFNNLHKQARAENAAGVVYSLMGNYAAGLQCFFAACQAYEDLMEPSQQANVLNNLGYSLIMLNDSQRALPYLQRSEKLARETGARSLLAAVLDSICHAWLNLGDFEQALIYSLESILISRNVGILREECMYCLSAGRVYQALDEISTAKESFRMSLDLAKNNGFRREETEALRRLAATELNEGLLEQAQDHLQQSITIAEAIQARHELFQSHQDLAEVYKQAGDYRQALLHYEQFHQVQQEVFNHEVDLRYKSLEVMHQLDQIQKESIIYQLKNRALQEEIENRKQALAVAELEASTDSLTGLLNHREFFRQAENCLVSARREGTGIAILMLDVDYFKTINDSYGHAAGDGVLITLSSRLRRFLRSNDLIGRIGGEEFCILLSGVSSVTARCIAERIRKGIEKQPFRVSETPVQVTVSLGLAAYTHGEADHSLAINQLIANADQALYEAKHTGRNRVIGYIAQNQLSQE
jgi:diguanylate cyclase (GGDEF)-like protein